MYVFCPVCKQCIPCDEDASCVETVPNHGNCAGAGRVGGVYPYDVNEGPPANYQEPESHPMPGWKREHKRPDQL